MRKTPAGLVCSPGFGFLQPLSLCSGRPIGEPRLNNRYYDYEGNYDAVKKRRRADVLTCGQWRECELEMTIGHEIETCEKVFL
jgi:hypothetical protein